MKKFNRIGVLTSGGDAPGMNAAVRAVVRTAKASGVEVMGIYRGYSGLIEGDIKPLSLRDVSNRINKGGTFLYSDRCPEFATPEGMAKGVETCKKFGIDGIVAVGGDGTFRGASALTNNGIPCVGIPGTIDNDITCTDSTIGYDTAMNTVVELIDKLRDTCESHARCNVVEVMGRGAGDIAINTAIGSGASAVVVPEFSIDNEQICKKIKHSRNLGKRNFIVVVSEGVGKEYGHALAKQIENDTGVETKFARLGHVVRGGNPNLRDRVLASMMGVYAVEKLLEGMSDIAICIRDGKICATDINYALTLDMIYKGNATEADKAKLTAEQLASIEERCKQRAANLARLYEIANKINI